jgi:hypothetical protein
MKNIQKSQYKYYYSQIAEIINSIDPVGLIAGGAPEDEYKAEISKILAVIQGDTDKKSIQKKIYQIFSESFDQETAGKKGNYEKIAEKIMELKLKGKL